MSSVAAVSSSPVCCQGFKVLSKKKKTGILEDFGEFWTVADKRESKSFKVDFELSVGLLGELGHLDRFCY
ncbi:hypothetical protein Q3G72_015949 [Acer saccharum]|nr:hypothetical protein Q3G72_015949 [Acer saccharum]